ncbi:MAG: glycosyltransferase family 39 protein [Candidatus Portnoybacteria bacterium]|jgi:hypothetical protein|nr:glycosyltransferase family 39 protein [Candidatus Portnoybacteria bacterium]
MKKNCRFFIILAIILSIGVFFRFWQLDKIPPGLYPDVAINGNDAWRALDEKDFKVFYPENNGREGLFINLISFSFWLFGPSVWAIKIVPAFFGALTIWGIYLFVRRLFSYFGKNYAEQLALLSAFFTAVSFWHVNFSRLGFRAVLVPFCLVWSFYFLSKALSLRTGENNRRLAAIFCWLAAGAFFGLGFHTYIAFRVAPLILIPVLAVEIACYWPRLKELWQKYLSFWGFAKNLCFKDGWWGWGVFLTALVVVILPLCFYFHQHPQDFMGRTGQVSVFSSAEPIKTLTASAGKTLGQFIFYGDGNWRHNLSGSPQIFWPLIPFFWLGLSYSFWQICRPKNYREKNFPALAANGTLAVWWLAMLLPAVLTNEGLPHALRTIGAIPPTYIFAAIGVSLFIGWLQHLINSHLGRKIAAVCLIVAALALAAAEYWRYFIVWGENPETRGAFAQNLADESRYLNSLPDAIAKFVLVNEGGVAVPYPDGLPMPAQTVIFLTGLNKNIHYFIPAPGFGEDQVFETEGPTIFLPLKYDQAVFQNLKKYFPSGQKKDFPTFSIFKLNF